MKMPPPIHPFMHRTQLEPALWPQVPEIPVKISATSSPRHLKYILLCRPCFESFAEQQLLHTCFVVGLLLCVSLGPIALDKEVLSAR